jgi:hypothetical protein
MSYPLARKAQAPPDFATEDSPDVDAWGKPASRAERFSQPHNNDKGHLRSAVP